MNFVEKLFLSFFLIVTLPAFAQKDVHLKSPDGNIVFSFKLTKEAPVYRVVYKEKTLIEDSELGLSFKEDDNFGKNLKMQKPRLIK